MSEQQFSRSIRINRPASEVYAWHLRPGALERLMPPWEKVEIVMHEGVSNGARVVLKSKVGPFWPAWTVEHREVIEDKQFRDVQIEGPFKSWEHLHRIEADGASACTLTDTIRYELPGGALGNAVAGGFVRRKLERLFAYRHDVTRADVELFFRYGTVRKLTFLISGASGLVGSALMPFLRSQGHEVVRLVRGREQGADTIAWDPSKGELDATRLRGIDVVINLSGENVAGGRWTAARRRAILASRVESTRTLVKAIETMRHRPFTFVSASAVGIYGDRGNEVLTEESATGSGFLAEVCRAWENETAAAEDLGLRAAALRAGVVLTPAGGALAKMLPVFRAGLGGRFGSGRQWMSWIAIDDLVGAIYHTVLDQRCSGPVNAVAPGAVTNAEFAKTLARVLKRRAMFLVPTWVLRALLGEMGDEALLAGAHVKPERLEGARYEFRQAKLEDALRHVLGR
jgi:uncharacterized protein (TIGR01777 family)